MIRFNFLNKLKFSDKRFRIFILSLFALFILIPVLVFALNNVREGYKSLANNGYDSQPVFWNIKNDPNDIASSSGACIINNSSNSYFVPTRTISEWTDFTNHMNGLGMFLTSGEGLPGGVCANGSCEGTEACDNNPSECGGCGSACPVGFLILKSLENS